MTPEQANDSNAAQGGVLAALPRTRPQRASARREAARARAQSETASTPTVTARGRDADERDERQATKAGAKAKPKKQASAKPKPPVKAKAKAAAKPKATTAKKLARRPSTKVRSAAKQEERAPKQGYEPEEEIELGNTVHPPSGGELIESIADIFGELAGLGANAGGRLLKDALSIFRRP